MAIIIINGILSSTILIMWKAVARVYYIGSKFQGINFFTKLLVCNIANTYEQHCA